MASIAAVDIGFGNIKLITGTKLKNEYHIESVETIPYIKPLMQREAVSNDRLEIFYRNNCNAIIEALVPFLVRMPEKTRYYFTFNSICSSLYTRILQAESKKRVNIAADLLLDKLSSIYSHTDCEVLSYDKNTQEAEVIFYAFNSDMLDDLQLLISELNVRTDSIEFDALCEANTLSTIVPSEELTLMVSVGATKSTCIYMQHNKIRVLLNIKGGMLSIYNRLAGKLGITLEKAEQLFLSEDSPLLEAENIDTGNLFAELLLQITNCLAEYPKYKKPEHVYLSGGPFSRWLMVSVAQNFFGTKAQVLDPFRHSDSFQGNNGAEFNAVYGLFIR